MPYAAIPTRDGATPSMLPSMLDVEAINPEATIASIGQAFDPGVFLASASPDRTIRRYRKGRVLFGQSDAADAVFYIRKGRIRITIESAQGKEAVLGFLAAGEFLGEACLIGQTRRSATATAMTETEVIRVSKAEMLRLLSTDPAFAGEFMRRLLILNGRLEENLVDQLLNSSEKRLARALLQLAHVESEGKPQSAALKIDQGTLARMVGTTRPRISQFMNKFRELGLISYDRQGLQVHDALLSSVLHESSAKCR